MSDRCPTPLLFGGLVLAVFLAFVPRVAAQTTSGGTEQLTLSAYLEQVVQANPTVREGRLQWLIKKRQAQAAWGAFEPTVDGSYKHTGLTQQNTAMQQYQQLGKSIYDQNNKVYSLKLQGNLPTGANYNIGSSVTRLQDTYSEQGQYQTFLGVSANQPLLKGATHGAPMASIRASFNDRIVAFQQYRKQLMQMIQKAETAYWNLAFAQQADGIAADSVRVARYLLNVAEQGAQLGKMSNLDVEQAKAELASQLANQNDSQLSVSDAETQLRLLLGSRGGAEMKFVATDPLVAGSAPTNQTAEQEQLLQWAYRAEPDYVISREQLQRERIVLGYQEDQLLPELNLSGSYGYTGLGDTVGQSIDALESQKYPTWSLGLELKIPLLLGIKERNDLAAEKLKMQLAEVRLKAAHSDLTRAVENLVHDVGTLHARIENAKTVSDVKRRLLNVEMARLQNGTVSLVDVYNAEDALNKARLSELQSIVRYRQAAMQLEMVSGSVLKDQGLEKLADGQVTLIESLRLR